MLANRRGILAKIESTYGTDPTPTVSSDEIQVMDLKWGFESPRMLDRPTVRTSFGKLKQVWGDTLGNVSFSVEFKGPGSAYSASVRPEMDVLLRACAMSVTVDTTPGSETCTYKPASSSLESITIYFYEDGMRHILTGCVGKVDFAWNAGDYGKANFTFIGHIATPTDTALPTFSYDTTAPAVVKNGAFTIGGTSLTIATLTCDLGNEISMPPDLSASDGFGEVQVTDRNVSGSFDPEAVLVATEPLIADWRAGTALALASGTIGATQYNKYSISMPAVSYRSIDPADRDRIITYAVGFGAHESSGDDEISIIFA
jgi:hypothetical protein